MLFKVKISVSLLDQLCDGLKRLPLPLELLTQGVHELGVFKLLVFGLNLALLAENE